MDFFLSQIHEFGAPNSRTTVVDFLQIHQIHEFVQIHVCVTGPLYGRDTTFYVFYFMCFFCRVQKKSENHDP